MTPEGWSRSAIGELGRVQAGRQRSPHFVEGSERPYLRVANVFDGRIDTRDVLRMIFTDEEFSRYKLWRGDVLLNEGQSLGLVGRAAIYEGVPADCAFQNTLVRFRANADEILPSFAFQVFRHLHQSGVFASIATQTTSIAHLGVSRFAGLSVCVPPLSEQKKIAAILSSVDDAIDGTQAVIDQLQVVKKAMMAELLTRGLPGRHSRFKQTEIGEVPEDWDVLELGALCERMFVGIAQAATHAYVATGGVPIIRTTNVRPNLLRTDDVLRINETFAEQMRTKKLRAGDVLSARTGYPGTSVVVPAELDGAQCFTLLVSRPLPRLSARFLCHMMNSAIGERIVQQGQAGGAQQNLNVGVFGKAIVGIPSLNEQTAISALIDALYEREWSEEATIGGLRELKSALMSVLLIGEVRVKPDEETA